MIALRTARCRHRVLGAIVSHLPTVLLAQDNIPESTSAATATPLIPASTYVAPVPIERRAPVYPWDVRGTNREGWVALSYIITATGEVAEAMVEDSTGNEEFERSALAAVRRWRFAPAIRDGVPVEQSMTRTIVRFQMIDKVSGASRGFRRTYYQIQELIAGRDLAKAEEMLTDLQYKERLNLYEDAWFWWLRYTYLDATGNARTTDLIDSLRRAIGYEEDYLPADVFVTAIGRLFVLYVRANDFSRALQIFERLSSSDGAKQAETYTRVHEAMQQQAAEIHRVIDGDATLSLDAEIDRNDYWVHRLLRRSFALSDVQNGELRAFEIRCDRRNARYDTVAVEQTLTVPASWGSCGIYVQGTPGTTFAFLEFPAAP